MIARVWHGWTAPENADAYERLLKEDIFPGIAAKGVAGYLGIDVLRRTGGAHAEGDVEFVTIMWFTGWDAVRAFVGDDPEAAYVPPRAREILARWDARSGHSEVRDRRSYPVPAP